MTINQPDLSFTKKPKWIAERETHWGPIEGFLKENNRKKVVEQLKKLFFTGVIDNPEDVREGFAILYYPLQTAEAWDYLFQDVRLNPKCFKEFMNASLMGSYNEKFFWDDEARLRFFDYFHPATYQSVIKSRVPIGREQKIVGVDVDVHELFVLMCGCMGNYLRRGLPTILIHRLDYFFSCLNELGDISEPTMVTIDDCNNYVERFTRQYFNFTPKTKLDDDSEQKAFLVRFYNHIANNPVHPSIKAIWQKVLDEHD
ncbi:hypothetical protein [Marinagarivorans algicola]|uniref:hypothetical protein n=1 Tax=Marinagarivorans algicola TaxID=1513270 RepID=UPI0006B8A7F5|nr:hypothetical protein [Marinagarivorans algicola]